MTFNLTTALVGVLITLIGALIALTWRSATLATKLLTAIQQLEKKDGELEKRLGAIDTIPVIEQRLGFVERHVSEIPRALSRIMVLEEAAKFSKEMRGVLLRRSRPDIDEE